MATTSGSLLGNYAPAMQEPYAIENTLAKDATGGSSAMANTLLNQYWYERQNREAQYGQRLGDQMQFGQQQLHAQLLDQNMRNMTEAAKTPGALAMFASSPQYGSAFAGMDPNAVQQASDIAGQTAQSQIFKNTGQGEQGFATAGMNVPPGGLTNLTSVPGITQGSPIAVQAAAMRNQGIVDAARIRAAGGGAGSGMTYSTNPDPNAGGIQFHGKIPPAIAAQGKAAIDAYVAKQGFGGPAQVPNPNATGSVNTAPPPVVQGRTNLPPMAKVDTPANAPAANAAPTKPVTTGAGPPGTVIPKSDPRAAAVQSQINAQIATNKNMSAADKANWGNVTLRVGTDNKVHVHDATGADRGPLPNG